MDWTMPAGTRWSVVASKWHDNIAYVHLSRKCYLTVWEDMNFKGTYNHLQHYSYGKTTSKDYEISDNGWIGRWWANDISSLECTCV